MKKLFRISTVPLSLNILLKGQLEYLSKFYDVTAISGAGKDLDEVAEREGVKIHEIEIERQISPFKDLVSLWKLYQYFKEERPEIIHSITPKAGLLSMIAGKMAGVPVRIHTFTGLVFPYKKGIFQKVLIFMDKILCSCSTMVYPEGNGVKNDLIKYKITQKPLKIIANGNVNGIDLDHFNTNNISESQRKDLKEKIGVSEDDFIYVFVGRLVKDKGINELVEAFSSQEFHDNSHVKLLLVGPFEQELDPVSEKTLQEIKENKNIIEVGFQQDVRPYFAISDVLVFPSYREGFPNVVMQAGAMGLPSIVTNINGCNEIVVAGKNGLIISPKDKEALRKAMLELYNNENLKQELSKNARIMISSRFDQQLVWESLKQEYDLLTLNTY